MDPDFNTFVSALTDGSSSPIGYGTDINGSGQTSSERQFFHQLLSNNGIDLGGQQIDHIELRFNKLELTSSAGRTDFSYGATVFVVAVPEPSVPTLFVCGIVGLLFRKRQMSPSPPRE